MSTFDRIRAAATAARKTRDPSVGVLVTLLGEIDTRSRSITPPRPLEEAEVVAIVAKFLKNAEESLAAVRDARPAQAVGIDAECAVLRGLLPARLTEEEIRAYVTARVRAGDGLGQVMAALKSDFPGRYDGRQASAIAREILETSRP